MKVYFDKIFKKNNEEKEERKKRILLYTVIILIILLSLITSCSCTSNFFGKIGDLFRKEDTFNITDETDDKEVHKNQELQFDENDIEMFVSDARTKISFSYQNISPDTFTCSTSDAEIATCYVSNNYVVVIPKTSGKVTVTLQTVVNGKIYEASTEVTIKDATKRINLSSKNGTINLAYTKYKNIPYSLVGLMGNIEVSSSDESIATASASNGLLKITAYKTGKVTITLSLTYNNITYTEKYVLNVINDKNKPSSGGSSSGSGSQAGESGEKPESPNNPSEPTDPSKPGSGEGSGSGEGEKDPNKPTNPVYQVTFIQVYPDATYYLDEYNKENPYYLKFEVKKDGISTNENVSIKTSDNITAEIVEINGEKFIKVTPKSDVSAGDVGSITISSHGIEASTTIDFKIHEYNLSIAPTEYNLGYTGIGGTKDFIIQTGNLFTSTLKVMDNENSLTICSNDNKTCVLVKVLEEYKDLIHVSYGTTSMEETSSLPIRVSITSDALNKDLSNILAYIEISATSYGQNLLINNKEEEVVTIHFVKNYTVRLHASYGNVTGRFSNGETLITVPIGVESTLALSDYVAFRYDLEGNCKYYPLISYNTKMDGTGTSYTPKDILSNITEDMDLYAIYANELEDVTINPETKKLYITDIDLFHNEEYFTKYGEDKVIYPGAKGSYVITFYNNTSSDIVIEGMTLEEDTICIENQGCLNMGYIIKYAAPFDKNYTYYYGKENGYTILNQDATLKNQYAPNRNLNAKKIAFGTGIPVLQGKGIEISLLWEWVDIDNVADTAIGIFANKHADKVNDIYKLTLSIDFSKNTCEKTE